MDLARQMFVAPAPSVAAAAPASFTAASVGITPAGSAPAALAGIAPAASTGFTPSASANIAPAASMGFTPAVPVGLAPGASTGCTPLKMNNENERDLMTFDDADTESPSFRPGVFCNDASNRIWTSNDNNTHTTYINNYYSGMNTEQLEWVMARFAEKDSLISDLNVLVTIPNDN
eukprot:scaffold7615_cov158-Amphora_coffeaeformis.AAC.3